MNSIQLNNDMSIVISGEAGQGLQSIEQIMSNLAISSGYNVFTYSEFMSRIRGGNNSTEIRISSKRITSYVDRIDIFIPMCKGAMFRFKGRIAKETIIIGDVSHIDEMYKDAYRIIYIPLLKIMKELGGNTYINSLIIGFISNLLGSTFDSAIKTIEKRFKNFGEEIINNNMEAVKTGFELSCEIIEADKFCIQIEKTEDVKNNLILYGYEAIGLGAIAGGCNFISSYPMSPSTGVFTFLAKNAETFGIIVEQAEDEISAINMGLGAWYAGGRAMVTTSGGGFALMAEALSLAGAIESPMVIHIGQRPGPATGMPTRTEQGDFLTALYSGHGEFPRIIFAPGDKEDGIRLTHQAFNMADKFQTPVIILTDQYFMDSSNNMNDFGITGLKAEKYFEITDDKYARYKFMGNGISPRGIPDHGRGIVRVDSDEHDENGYLTEDFNVRKNMVNKRIKKMESIKQETIPPAQSGSNHYKYAVVCWGSVRNTAEEAIAAIARNDIACFSFTQLYPLYNGTADLLKSAEKLIIIENNATSQFGTFIKQETGIEFDHKILKYNGMPFSVEEITAEINKALLKE
ncbi:MAG: 2-oxoacid:acceptor oxidoreductase subunit alpha [Spirochaetes bacterium]|nr:2-oxoacid:acceptor oxidoreductase subunit alpha [Spirochaetota bacterium]